MRKYKKVTILDYHGEHGTSYWTVRCECGCKFALYVWSYWGSGKRCPSCKSFVTIRGEKL